MAAGAKSSTKTTWFLRTPLHWAAGNGRVEIIKTFERHVEPVRFQQLLQITDAWGATALDSVLQPNLISKQEAATQLRIQQNSTRVIHRELRPHAFYESIDPTLEANKASAESSANHAEFIENELLNRGKSRADFYRGCKITLTGSVL